MLERILPAVGEPRFILDIGMILGGVPGGTNGSGGAAHTADASNNPAHNVINAVLLSKCLRFLLKTLISKTDIIKYYIIKEGKLTTSIAKKTM
jgi:hypothetical protein